MRSKPSNLKRSRSDSTTSINFSYTDENSGGITQLKDDEQGFYHPLSGKRIRRSSQDGTGFAIFPTETRNWNIVSSDSKR